MTGSGTIGAYLKRIPPPGPLFRRIIRDPLFLFLLVGAGFFFTYSLIRGAGQEPIRYTPQIESALVEEFELLTGRKAGAADRLRMRNQFIADELLFREAIARGMHLTDSETRKKLTDKVRYLIAGAPPEPTEEQVVNHYSENLPLYQAEPKTTFSQVFFSQKPADPATILATLNRGERVTGDDFWLGRDYPRYGQSMIRGIFGQPFVETLAKAPQGTWTGPIRTGRGWHFVRKAETEASVLIPYREIREQVRQDYMMAQTSSVIDREVDTLREKYDVEITR